MEQTLYQEREKMSPLARAFLNHPGLEGAGFSTRKTSVKTLPVGMICTYIDMIYTGRKSVRAALLDLFRDGTREMSPGQTASYVREGSFNDILTNPGMITINGEHVDRIFQSHLDDSLTHATEIRIHSNQ